MEVSINTTSDMISRKGIASGPILERFDQYRSIVKKQREMAFELQQHFEASDWIGISRSVQIIGSLSSMIRDDAAMILGKKPVIDASNPTNFSVYH